MAEIKKIVKRRKSAKNIKKITETMALIATTRFQASLRRVRGIQPYTERLNELLQSLVTGYGYVDHPLLTKNEEQDKVAVLLFTSSRGLCGSYNSNMIQFCRQTLQELHQQELRVELHTVGKKGYDDFRNRYRDLEIHHYPEIGDIPKYQDVQKVTRDLIRRYSNGELREVRGACMAFLSPSRQRPQLTTLLPFTAAGSADAEVGQDYFIHPDPQQIFDYIVPQSVRMNFFRVFLEAAASEHVQRMMAMNAATDNAEKMIKGLTQMYNRARQAQITKEISEIMGAVRALRKE